MGLSLSEVQGAFINPFGHGIGGQRILKKISPKFQARSNDFISGNAIERRVLRKFDMVPLGEFQRKPEILTKEFEEKKKQRALVASVRRNSVDAG